MMATTAPIGHNDTTIGDDQEKPRHIWAPSF
jgi:hypothetical protein